MIRRLFKNPLFIIGFSFIVLLLIASVLYSVYFKDIVATKIDVLYTKSGDLIASPPYPPKTIPPFGTDKQGNNLLYVVLDGAKYTILFAMAIGILRVGLGMLFGITRALFGIKVKTTPSTVLQSLQTVPVALLLYFILQPVVFDLSHYVHYESTIGAAGASLNRPPDYGTVATIIFELILLTLVALPTVTRLIGDESSLILRKDFIESTRTLGAGKWHILRKHIMPHLWPKLIITFVQQMIQALLIIMHLGVLELFFGGTKVIMLPFNPTVIVPKTNEWSGLVGHTFDLMLPTPWVPLAPILMFTITILAMNFILEGLKVTLQTNNNRESRSRKLKKDRQQKTALTSSIGQDAFQTLSK